MPSGVVSVGVLADFAELIEQSDQAGLSIEAFSGKVVTSSRTASRAMVDLMKTNGASADEMEDAAARVAAAWDATYGQLSRGAKDQANAALMAARAAGESADQQSAAYAKAAAAARDAELQQKTSADAIAKAQETAAAAAKASADVQARAAKLAADAQADAAAKADLLNSRLGSLGERSVGVAAEISKLGSIALVGSIAGMGDLAAKYQEATESIAANSGISSKAAANIGKAFLGTSGTTIYSAKEMTEAFALVAGQLKSTEGQALGTAGAMKVMSVASNLGEATGETLSSATSALSIVMQGYKLSVGQAASAGDLLFNTSRALDQPMNTVAQAVNRLHGRLGTLAPSLGDVGGLMVEIGSHGVQGTRGVSVMNTAFQTLIGHSQPVDEMLDDLGVHIFNAQGKFVGMQQVIAQLQPKFAQLSQQSQDLAAKTLFGSSASQVMLSVINRGPQAFASYVAAAQKSGTAAKGAADQTKTFAKQFDILKATIDNTATSIGLKLMPALTTMSRDLADGVDWLTKNKSAAEALGIAIAGTLGTAVTVFAYQKAVAFVSGVKGMVTGVQNLASTLPSVSSAEGETQTETQALTAAIQELTTALSPVPEDATATADAVSLVGSRAETAVGQLSMFDGELDATVAQLDAVTTAAEGAAGAIATVGTDALATGGELAGAGATGGSLLAGGGVLAAGLIAPAVIGHFLTPQLANMFGGNLKGIGASVPGFTGAQFDLPGGAKNVNQIKTLQDQLNGVTKPTQRSMSQWKDYSAEVTKIQHNLPDMTAGQREGFDKLQTAIKDTITALEKYKTAQASTSTSGAGWGQKVKTAESAGANPNVIRWAKDAQEAAAKYKVNPALLLADIQQESQGIPGQTSAAGAKGLTQFMPGTAAKYGVQFGNTPAEILSQIMGQAHYLSALGVNQNATAALEGYNTGTVGDTAGAGYAQSVLGAMQNYSPLFTGKLGGIQMSGTAAGTAAIPAGVATMLATAQSLVGTKYTSGGGHNGWDPVAELKKIGVDCSGFVSQVLHSGGVSLPGPLTTTGLAQNLKPGAGKQGVTVYDRATGPYGDQHTLIDLMGKFFESGGNSQFNPSGGVSELSAAQARGELAGGGFEALHPVLGKGGLSSALGAAVMNIGSGGQLPAAIQATSYASQATALQDQTTKAQAVGQAQVTVLQAINQQLQDKGAAIVQKLSDRQAKADDQSAKIVTTLKDSTQTASDKATAQVTALKDQQTINDENSAILVAKIQDQTTAINDASAITVAAINASAARIADADNAQATLITDNAQTNADTINERGLYGLNLVAQQLQVVADQVKTGFDTQIATAQATLDSDQGLANIANAQAQQATDQVTATQTMLELQAQQNLNTVTLKQDALEAKAQAHLDAVTAKQDALEAAAKIHVDSVTMTQDAKANAAKAHLDSVTISQDNRILKATQHADAVQLHVDTSKIGPAQTIEDWAATQSKTIQTQAQNNLNLATAQGNVSVNAAQLQLQNVTAGANDLIASAQNSYQKVQNAANTAIQTATNQYQAAQDKANQAIQTATSQYTGAQDKANAAIQNATDNYQTVQDTANLAIAKATQTAAQTASNWATQLAKDQLALTGIQGKAAIGEASTQGAVTTEQALESTQFAGSGLVVNQYGVDLSNPAAVSDAASWAIRASGIATA